MDFTAESQLHLRRHGNLISVARYITHSCWMLDVSLNSSTISDNWCNCWARMTRN